MRYRLLGTSGLRVSEVALGTLNFGEPRAWGVAAPEAAAMLATFAERGGTFIDTAPNYAGGAAETILGDVLGADRDRFVIATKYTAANDRHVLAGGNSARTMIRSVEDSLRRLKTDYIDLLWLHYWDGTTPLWEILKAFDALIAAGKLRYCGFSDTPAWLVSRAVTLAESRGWAMPVAIQAEYSLAARDAERELFPMAAALGLGAVTWGPLAAGALAAGPDPRRRTAEAIPRDIRELAERLTQVAARAGMQPLDLALRWLMLRQGAPSPVPILGARDAAQLMRSLDTIAGEVDSAFLNELDAATRPRLGFPHDLIGSTYLRKLALGDPEALMPPAVPRA